MAEPTFDIFGSGTIRLASGVSVSEDGLFIPDSALIAAGLLTPTTASAEAHVVAIVKNLQAGLTIAGYDASLDQSLYFDIGLSSFTTRGENDDSYRLDEIRLYLAKIDTDATLNPSDY